MYNPSKQVWINPNIQYLFDNEIIEYDMQDAGFSLIKQFKLLPDEKINELTKMGKGKERHIKIGKMQGEDKVFSKALSDKFADLRKIFISVNNLTDNEILYMLDFIRNIISMIESKDIRVRRYLIKFIMDYKQHNLDDGYYLEFNSKSKDINILFNYREVIIKFLQIVIKEI